MEKTLHSKAWKIDTSNFAEPWFAPDDIWYAETRGKAKKIIFDTIRHDGYQDSKFNEITFLSLNVVRAKHADKYLVNGEVKKLDRIEYDEKVEERNKKLDKLLCENPNGYAYIKKGGYYYMSGYCGYTEFRTNAGVYTLQDAIEEVKRCSLKDSMAAILIDNEEHNKLISEKIEELKKKLILVFTTV